MDSSRLTFETDVCISLYYISLYIGLLIIYKINNTKLHVYII